MSEAVKADDKVTENKKVVETVTTEEQVLERIMRSLDSLTSKVNDLTGGNIAFSKELTKISEKISVLEKDITPMGKMSPHALVSTPSLDQRGDVGDLLNDLLRDPDVTFKRNPRRETFSQRMMDREDEMVRHPGSLSTVKSAPPTDNLEYKGKDLSYKRVIALQTQVANYELKHDLPIHAAAYINENIQSEIIARVESMTDTLGLLSLDVFCRLSNAKLFKILFIACSPLSKHECMEIIMQNASCLTKGSTQTVDEWVTKQVIPYTNNFKRIVDLLLEYTPNKNHLLLDETNKPDQNFVSLFLHLLPDNFGTKFKKYEMDSSTKWKGTQIRDFIEAFGHRLTKWNQEQRKANISAKDLFGEDNNLSDRRLAYDSAKARIENTPAHSHQPPGSAKQQTPNRPHWGTARTPTVHNLDAVQDGSLIPEESIRPTILTDDGAIVSYDRSQRSAATEFEDQEDSGDDDSAAQLHAMFSKGHSTPVSGSQKSTLACNSMVQNGVCPKEGSCSYSHDPAICELALKELHKKINERMLLKGLTPHTMSTTGAPRVQNSFPHTLQHNNRHELPVVDQNKKGTQFINRSAQAHVELFYTEEQKAAQIVAINEAYSECWQGFNMESSLAKGHFVLGMDKHLPCNKVLLDTGARPYSYISESYVKKNAEVLNPHLQEVNLESVLGDHITTITSKYMVTLPLVLRDDDGAEHTGEVLLFTIRRHRQVLYSFDAQNIDYCSFLHE